LGSTKEGNLFKPEKILDSQEGLLHAVSLVMCGSRRRLLWSDSTYYRGNLLESI